MSYFELDTKDFERIIRVVEDYSDGSEAERIINGYLAGEGGDLIKERVHEKLPVSGRTWPARKKPPAKSTDPFRKTAGNLSVKVHTKYAYHYLYFPDDGSDTERHYGNQQFMLEGAGDASETIANEVIEKLLERLEEM